MLKLPDLRRLIEQVWAWHFWLQHEAVPKSLIDGWLQKSPGTSRRRRTIYAIALTGVLGTGGLLAATHHWNEEPAVSALQHPNVQRTAAPRATPEQLVPQVVAQPEIAPAPNAVQTQPMKLTPPRNQGLRTTTKHNRVAPARVAASMQSTLPDYLDKPTVRLHVQRTLDRIKNCYDGRLVADPTLAGTVRTHFVILPSGAVTSSIASGVDSELESCILNILNNIHFPKSRNRVRVAYPFHFTLNENPEISMSW